MKIFIVLSALVFGHWSYADDVKNIVVKCSASIAEEVGQHEQLRAGSNDKKEITLTERNGSVSSAVTLLEDDELNISVTVRTTTVGGLAVSINDLKSGNNLFSLGEGRVYLVAKQGKLVFRVDCKRK